jgi:hypothetical protein
VQSFLAQNVLHGLSRHAHVLIENDDFLRDMFIQYRQVLVVYYGSQQLLVPGRGDCSSAIARWVLAYKHANHGRLLNCFLDTKERLSASDTKDTPSTTRQSLVAKAYWITRGCLVLALLCVTVPCGGNPIFAGKHLYGTLPVAHRHLYTGMMRALDLNSAMGQREYDEAHLWCPFVGAQLEQREAKREQDKFPSERRTHAAAADSW